MHVQHDRSKEETIKVLQQQVEELTEENHALKEQLTDKEQFIAMVAHELRGPLTPIINYAQKLSRHVCSPETESDTNKRTTSIQRGTGIIIGQSNRMLRLVNDLLDAPRLSSGHFSLVRESCDLASLVRESVEQLRPLAPYHTLVTDIPDMPVVGNYDSMRLQQVIGNLLDNAIKYSDEHTVITVRLWITSEYAYVSVHNEGTSIPSADIGQLFRPYVRLQSGSKQRGTGLGLYIAHSIIEAHGGTLVLERHSEESDKEAAKGTTFVFTLPL